MLYSEKDLRSITTGEEKFFDSAKKPALRYRNATFALGSSSFRMSVGTEFLKVSSIQKRGTSTTQYPHLVRLTLCPLSQHPFLVIKEALKKDCKQEVEFCFINRVYLNTDLYTLSALMKALKKPLTTHLILTIKLRHVLFRDNYAPRIKYVLEHVEEVMKSYEGTRADQEFEAQEEDIGLNGMEQEEEVTRREEKTQWLRLEEAMEHLWLWEEEEDSFYL
jgi:hypothetical protein